MKIITDPDLINYRLALQDKLKEATGDLCVFLDDLRLKRTKNKQITEADLHILRHLIEIVANMFYEIEYGNYFMKMDQKKKDEVLNNLTKRYFENVLDNSVEDIALYTLMNIYDDMEFVLEKVLGISKK